MPKFSEAKHVQTTLDKNYGIIIFERMFSDFFFNVVVKKLMANKKQLILFNSRSIWLHWIYFVSLKGIQSDKVVVELKGTVNTLGE